MENQDKSKSYHSKLGYFRRLDDSLKKWFSACVRLIIVGAKRVRTLDANKFLKFERDLIWKLSNSN